MKIGIDISQIVYGTGVSTYTRNLVENLLRIDDKNEYILFGSSLRAKKKLKNFIEELSEFKNFEPKLASIPPTLLEIMWNNLHVYPLEKFIGEVDVFHSSDWTQPKIASLTTKKVTTIHDMVPYLFTSSLPKKISDNQKKRLEHVKKEVDLIIADSQTTKDDVMKFLEIPEEKIKVIYLSADPQFKNQGDDKVNEVLEKYKIKKPYILSVATQEPRKNIQKLIDVFTQIQLRRPELHLVLSGKYGWGPGFHSTENVIWTDYVPKEDLMALYSGCRVFVYPSLYEGFGLPVLEAMACGAPVITSNNSSMAEIAKDAAILVDPRSTSQLTRAIEMLLDLNLENYQKMVRASLYRAKAYNWTKTAQDTLKVYEEAGSSVQKPEESSNTKEEPLEEKEEDDNASPDLGIVSEPDSENVTSVNKES